MTSCPRCQSDNSRVEHEGRENGALVWTVHHCTVCRFTWRDTEPAATIRYAERDPFFRVDASDLEKYPVQLPRAGY